MKTFSILLVSLSLLLSCNQQQSNEVTWWAEPEIEMEISYPPMPEEVILTVLPTTIILAEELDTVHVSMFNNTADTITTGLRYQIERYEDKEWNIVSPQDIVFNDLGWTLNPTESQGFDQRLYKDQVDYKPGKYRFTMYYIKTDYQNTKQDYTVYREFEVQ